MISEAASSQPPQQYASSGPSTAVPQWGQCPVDRAVAGLAELTGFGLVGGDNFVSTANCDEDERQVDQDHQQEADYNGDRPPQIISLLRPFQVLTQL